MGNFFKNFSSLSLLICSLFIYFFFKKNKLKNDIVYKSLLELKSKTLLRYY